MTTISYPGFNVLLMGPSGTGKTRAISTLVSTGLKVRALFLEPGLETLIGVYSDAGKPIPENLAWHYIQPKTLGFDALKSTAELVGKFDLKALASMKDAKRSENNQAVEVYTQLNDFHDQRTGKKLGSADSWGTDTVLVVDSLSALNRIFMDMVVGTKPVRDQADWQVAQNNLMNIIHKLTSGCMCHFVLIAHVERLVDEVLGGVKLMPQTLGKAVAPQLPQPFSDVILSAREAGQWVWDTASTQADVKTRNLTIGSKLPPDFGPIYNKWLARQKLATGIAN